MYLSMGLNLANLIVSLHLIVWIKNEATSNKTYLLILLKFFRNCSFREECEAESWFWRQIHKQSNPINCSCHNADLSPTWLNKVIYHDWLMNHEWWQQINAWFLLESHLNLNLGGVWVPPDSLQHQSALLKYTQARTHTFTHTQTRRKAAQHTICAAACHIHTVAFFLISHSGMNPRNALMLHCFCPCY